jgi:hypothetical protein
VTLDVKVEWLDSALGKAGHTFNFYWLNETGAYVQVATLNPTTTADKTDQKQVAMKPLFPNFAGCFGVNALKFDPFQVSPIGLNVTDDYRWTITETVNYTVV